ncbi:MAG: TolC family protein [Pontiella sp.]
MNKLLLLFSATCVAALSFGADPFGTNLTLQAVLDYGAENNPRLQATFNQWKGAEENIAVQKALPDPAFTYGYYFEPIETKNGPQNQRFDLSQKIPGFGKLSLNKAIATDQAAAAHDRYRREQLDLDFTTTQAYAELHFLKRGIEITQDQITLFLDLEKVARTRYQTGSPMASILQAQVELGRLEDRLNSLNDQRAPKTARLNAALNRPASAPLPWPDTLPYRTIDADAKALHAQTRGTSPELAELGHHIERGNHQLQLAKRERLPDFTLGVQYIDTGHVAGPNPDSGTDPIIGTIGINLPLWFGKNRARIQSAAHLKTAAQLALENRAKTLDADIRQTLFQLRDADRKINLYKESLIPKSLQSLEVSRTGYESGQLEFINLIDAERLLLEFELSYERARTDHLIARAELTNITGIDFINVDGDSSSVGVGEKH